MKAFISYSHKDAAALERLHVHLAMLKRDGLIETWFDREILAGEEIDAEIENQLESCELFLLLISPDFLASDYCYDKEMTRAFERHDAGEAQIVPLIIEPCEWTSSRLRKLKAIPRDGKAVSEWTNENNAYLDIVTELRRLLETTGIAVERSDENAVTTQQHAVQARHRYRVQRGFDEIDRSDFRDKAFAIIRDYFEKAIIEIDDIEGLRGRFVDVSPAAFGCTIVNKSRDHGTAHITVHRRSRSVGFGDISYSFSENAPANTSNGSFNIEADEYELYLSGITFGFSGEDKRITPEEAAEQLWMDFLEQAGITYD